jgi:hypothetical protein
MSLSHLPFGRQFSPAQVDLLEVLELARAHEGSTASLRRAIGDRFFSKRPPRPSGASGRSNDREGYANNTILAMKAYDLIMDDSHADSYAITDTAKHLLKLRKSPAELYKSFAQHILLNVNGQAVIDAVKGAEARGLKLTREHIVETLAGDPHHVTKGDRDHLTTMNHWLAKAGVFKASGAYEVDDAAVDSLVGTSERARDALASCSPEEQEFLIAFASLGATPMSHDKIVRHAERTAHRPVRYDMKQIPKTVLARLEAAGFIKSERTSGGKPYIVHSTSRLKKDILSPLLKQ